MEDVTVIELRGIRVVSDAALARAFGTTTGRLNERVRANADRFGDGFAFQVTEGEWKRLQSENAITKTTGRGGRRTPPWVYTEHGVVMAATVLRTDVAIAASRTIVETFVAARRAGRNGAHLPAAPAPLPTTAGTPETLAAQANAVITRILDSIANAEEAATVRQEGQAIIGKSLNAIKAHLDAKGISNEKTLAEVRRQLKEIEDIDADIIAKSIEADHRRLAYLAKQLQLVIGLQTYLETGGAESFLDILRGLAGD